MLTPNQEEGLRFRDLKPEERIFALVNQGFINRNLASGVQSQSFRELTRLVSKYAENVFGAFPMAWGAAEHFIVNGREIPGVPMVTEEPTVIAAASKAAKLAGPNGFSVKVSRNLAIGEIVFTDVDNPNILQMILAERPLLEAWLREKCDPMKKYGGGLGRIEAYAPRHKHADHLIVRIKVNVGNAMGANVTTRMAEVLGLHLGGKYLGGRKPLMAICSNRSRRLAHVRCIWPESIVPAPVAERIVDAQRIAEFDEYRTPTHNKGIMNGVTAVCLATGQDTRAIEASAHSHAARSGRYLPLTKYRMSRGGLYGQLEISLPVATVGGATDTPFAQLSRELMRTENADELACVIGAAGLAQNFAALHALVTDGISVSKERV